MHALVIDDSRAIRKILGQFLKEMSFQVTEAQHGAEALEKLNELKTVDLALVDWNMPEMNGYEFVCEARKNPDHANMKIMMVTTESEIPQVQKALEAGANEYVMKPFTREVIREKLELIGISVG